MSFQGVLCYLFKTLTRRHTSMLNPGETAPDFEAKDAYGRDVRLRDYRGSKVVLWFFPKANTPG